MSWGASLWRGIKTVFGFTSVDGSGVQNVMEVARGVGQFLDEQQFTEQERKEFSLQVIGKYAEFLQLSMNENTERSQTRRVLAIMIMRWWLFWISVAFSLRGFSKPWAEFILGHLTSYAIGGLALGVGAFFFGVHVLRTKGKE